MAELHLLNIDPGNEPPLVSQGTAPVALPLVPDCPDCGANHWMHQSPTIDVTELVCMSCGKVHTVARSGGG